jgi:dihydroorotase
VEQKVRIAKRKACVDFAFYGGIGRGSKVDALAKICKAFKIYLCRSNDIFVPVERLRNVLQRVRRTGKILAVHAEHEPCLSTREAYDLAAYEHTRPVKCELAALQYVLTINEGIGTPLHICHISSVEGMALARARASVGITPHHMLLSTSSVFSAPAMGKVNPPLRSERERENMWRAAKKGIVTLIESDHAPHLREEKQDFNSALPGMPGVDAMLPLFLFMVKKGTISLSSVHSLMCERPARRFSINKGVLEVGRDADILAIDFKEKNIVPYSRCGWTCYEGWKGIYPRHFWLRGDTIIENGEFIGSAGEGEMIA